MGNPNRGSAKKSEQAPFQLDDFFPYLINRATGIIRADFELQCKPLGISVEMWRVLICLLTKGPQNITNLAEITTIEVPTMSFLLKRMIKKGLIIRGRHEYDGRVAVIHLTSRGHAIAQRVLPTGRQYEMIAFRGFSDKQIETVKSQLRAILRNLECLHEQPHRLAERAPAKRVRSR